MRNTYLALALLLGNHLLSQEILYQASWDVTEKESYVLESENDLELYDFMDRSKLVDRSTNYHQEESIDDEYFLQRKLTYLSNSFEDAESWMDMPGGFVYGKTVHQVLNQDGSVRKTYGITDTEMDRNTMISAEIAANGYHPGLPEFPWLEAEQIAELESEGAVINVLDDYTMHIQLQGMDVWLNRLNWSVKTLRSQGQDYYETTRQYLPNEDYGFLLLRERTLKPFQSYGGACVTQITDKKYSNYTIQDEGGLMEQYAQPTQDLNFELYPNPVSEEATVLFPEEEFSYDVEITTLVIRSTSGEMLHQLEAGTTNSFDFTLPSGLPAGTYILEVHTSNSGSFFQTFSKI
ncbi:MAG: hypothetical protein CMI36_07855 [Owenweeksia sp.]|nr:hypothetical protein [Owenweeksia sp.]MBF98890.1 hypothetical protein [Owenweeksia sp.]HBF20727.1 hypothetical protein [Cryomorphaceae bacterium]HCQ14790.1 hypothetical protein [Cryomorphaceae bacterium]|tara:strand:- start:1328 stop:2374 length:1047 start_codon:yes stop_codon:yes gene_type:complete